MTKITVVQPATPQKAATLPVPRKKARKKNKEKRKSTCSFSPCCHFPQHLLPAPFLLPSTFATPGFVRMASLVDKKQAELAARALLQAIDQNNSTSIVPEEQRITLVLTLMYLTKFKSKRFFV